jgi:hypothetical protein
MCSIIKTDPPASSLPVAISLSCSLSQLTNPLSFSFANSLKTCQNTGSLALKSGVNFIFFSDGSRLALSTAGGYEVLLGAAI